MRVNRSNMWRLALLSVAAALLFSWTTAVAYEEPEYEIARSYAEFELRRYAPYLVAETEVSGDFEEVGNKAFRILADFISGNNKPQEKIEMTVPVNQRPKAMEGEKIEMAAPVTQRATPAKGKGDTYLFSFVMPSRYTLETLPEPVDPRVRIREEPGKLLAVRQYSGRWTVRNYRKNEALLIKAIEEAGLKPVAAPVYARYNSPFSLWFLRRNEVMVEVHDSKSPPTP